MAAEVDVLVAGGGPAGAAAARELSRRGRSVLVCEKATFPRDKSCGDGLTPRAVRALAELGVTDALQRWKRVQGVRAHLGARSRTFEFPAHGSWPEAGVVVPRHELDALVLDRACDAGAKVLDGAEIVEVAWRDGRVVGAVVERDGSRELVRSEWLVCADGAGGRVARALGARPREGAQRALAMRQYFPASRPVGEWFEVFLDVRVGGSIVPGYGWVFPVGDGTVNAGVGFNSSAPHWRGSSLHALMRAFEARLPPEWGIGPDTATCAPRAGRLPLGGAVGPVQGPGFVLVGDAAGWINPATGEGIAYAYETGAAAARHLDEVLDRGRDLGAYETEMRERYGPYFRVGGLVARGLGRPRVAEAMVRACMLTQAGFDFTMTVFTHLEEPDRSPTQVGFRALERLAGRRRVPARP